MTPAGPRITPPGRWSDLAARMASAAIMIAIGVALILSSGLPLRFALALVTGGLLWELARVTGWQVDTPSQPRRHLLVGIVGGIATFLTLVLPELWAVLPFFVVLAAGLPGTPAAQRVPFVAFTVAFFIAAVSFVYVREVAGLGTILWLVLTVILSDVLGYFVGRSVGGPKFWPAISPKKTWSGTLGGLIGAAVLAAILAATGQAPWFLVWIGAFMAFIGQMGDIAESWLKRRVGIKDSSQLIPGHGGLMDRFDALTAALVAAYVFSLFSLIPQVGG